MGGIAILAVLWGIYRIWFAGSGGAYQFVTVTPGPITEAVNVTGNTAPVQSLDLAFQSAGTIASVSYPVGSTVHAGDVIARLDAQSLAAQLAQAQANVDTQEANAPRISKLAQHRRASPFHRPRSQPPNRRSRIRMRTSRIPLTSAYSSANDAMRNQLDSILFRIRRPTIRS